jgi:hypothetical protein
MRGAGTVWADWAKCSPYKQNKGGHAFADPGIGRDKNNMKTKTKQLFLFCCIVRGMIAHWCRPSYLLYMVTHLSSDTMC